MHHAPMRWFTLPTRKKEEQLPLTTLQFEAQTCFSNCSLRILINYSYSALKHAPEIRIDCRCRTQDPR